jgi:hypothetical protein
MSTIRVASRKLVAALLLLMAAAAFANPRPAYATTCTDSYEACLFAAQGRHWLIRELAYQECFWKWVGCVGREAAF